MPKQIQSIGPPPEKHADRVVAEMMRHLATQRAHLWPAIHDVIANCKDGSPKAQRKMADRINAAGATYTKLTPGKRGKYCLEIFDMTGWDPMRNNEITLDDRCPRRPWLAHWVSVIESSGNGRCKLDFKAAPFVFVTHHALSRAAQRLGARTVDDLIAVANAIWGAADHLVDEMGIGEVLEAPPGGWLVPIFKSPGSAKVALTRHNKRRALVAATVYD
jgi:hypothetical protein